MLFPVFATGFDVPVKVVIRQHLGQKFPHTSFHCAVYPLQLQESSYHKCKFSPCHYGKYSSRNKTQDKVQGKRFHQSAHLGEGETETKWSSVTSAYQQEIMKLLLVQDIHLLPSSELQLNS